jgi:hypothetical protein
MMDLVQQRIEELNRHHTVSRFQRQFHALIAARLGEGLPESAGLVEVFAAYLAAQIAYHRRLEMQQGLGGMGMSVRDLVSLAHWHRDALETCQARIVALGGEAEDADELGALLMVACDWGLGAHREAVATLERVVEGGSDTPVIQFALGLNRYLAAEQECVAADIEPGQDAVTDLIGYRTKLLDAVSAFEDSLTGGPLDADARRWITLCLERAGFRHAALGGGEEDAADGGEAGDEPYVGEGVEPITLDEIRRVAQELKRPQSLLKWRQGE